MKRQKSLLERLCETLSLSPAIKKIQKLNAARSAELVRLLLSKPRRISKRRRPCRVIRMDDVMEDGRTARQLMADDKAVYAKRAAQNKHNRANVVGPCGEAKF